MTEEQIIAVRELRAHIQAACVDHIEHLLSQTQSELEQAHAEVANLKESLEPGKASAICHGMFTAAGRLGFYKPTAKHALTQFVEEVEGLRKELGQAQRERDEEIAEIAKLRAALQNAVNLFDEARLEEVLEICDEIDNQEQHQTTATERALAIVREALKETK